ncbi:PIN domain-containing protein [Dickeya oryzae]|uniref:PIN domain-containing protein n=1 Tax=Dickeya oryzae TaxID=1240404 RepID=UPI0031613991
MELQTRLVFIDTSAYEAKNFQFGHHALGRLEKMVIEEKIHLLITDVVRSEIESHLKIFSDKAVRVLKKCQKEASFLLAAEKATGGGHFANVSAEAVLDEVTEKFTALMDNGLTELVSVSTVDPVQIFNDYFSAMPPFHRESKKHEFPDAFSLAAIDAVARARSRRIYIVSQDGDMKAVAEANPNFIPLGSLDELLDLVNRNDKEFAELSIFADSVLQQLMDDVLSNARNNLHNAEFAPSSSGDADPEINEVKINSIRVEGIQLIEVDTESARYDVVFDVSLTVHYDFIDYSEAHWDKEEGIYIGLNSSSETFLHQEQYAATLVISFSDGQKTDGEVLALDFDDAIFDLDLDNAQYLERFPND